MRLLAPLFFTTSRSLNMIGTAAQSIGKAKTMSTVSVSSGGALDQEPTEHVTEPAIDPDYPGTAVARMLSIRERVRSTIFSGSWEDMRRQVIDCDFLIFVLARTHAHVEPRQHVDTCGTCMIH